MIESVVLILKLSAGNYTKHSSRYGVAPTILGTLVFLVIFIVFAIVFTVLWSRNIITLPEYGIYMTFVGAYASLAGLVIYVWQYLTMRERYPRTYIETIEQYMIRGSYKYRLRYNVRNDGGYTQHNIRLALRFKGTYNASDFKVESGRPGNVKFDVQLLPNDITELILEISRIPAKDFESIIIEAPTIPLHGPVIVAPGHGEKATVSSETP